MAWGTWRGWPLSGGISPGDLPLYFQEWLIADDWLNDPSNTRPKTNRSYGVSPGGTFSAYWLMDFPAVWQVSAQYYYYPFAPKILNWTSTRLRFRCMFIVETNISLPGGYRFQLGVRTQPEPSTVIGTKLPITSDYTLADSNNYMWRISDWSSALTIPGASSDIGYTLELTRGTNPVSDESDSAYVIGVQIQYLSTP